ncbi:MAG: hypothetical protein RR161_03915 [Bacilli bacterium]
MEPEVLELIKTIKSISTVELEEELASIQRKIININLLQNKITSDLADKKISFIEFNTADRILFHQLTKIKFEENKLTLEIALKEYYKERLRVVLSFCMNKLSTNDASRKYFEMIKSEVLLSLQCELVKLRLNKIDSNATGKKAEFEKFNDKKEIEEIVDYINMKTFEQEKFSIIDFDCKDLLSLNAEIVFDRICLKKGLLK